MRDVLGGDLFSRRHSITIEGRVLEVRGAQVSDTDDTPAQQGISPEKRRRRRISQCMVGSPFLNIY